MELVVKRCALKPTYTIGKLFIDGVFFCHTCEDCDRGLTDAMTVAEIKKKKIYGQTAIPLGKYEVRMDIKSPKYSTRAKFKELTGGYMPKIDKIKGYEGVLIHVGNSAADTLGCILVGDNTVVGKVMNSFNTFTKLYKILKEAHDRGEKITISIERR